MKKIAIANEKAIVAGINKAWNKMESAKKGYVYSVIELGEKLNEAKEKVPHGEWQNWVSKHNSELCFGAIQASKFMKIANNKLLVLEYFNNESSIDNLAKAITDATPEQLQKAAELKQAEIEKSLAEKEAAYQKQQEAKAKPAAPKEPDIIEGEFTEVKPVSKPEKKEEAPEERPEENPIDMLNEVIDVLQNDNKELLKEIESVTKVFESNDQLATAIAEVKKFQELNRVLEERLRGMQNECNAAKRQAKEWKSKYDRLAKEVGREC